MNKKFSLLILCFVLVNSIWAKETLFQPSVSLGGLKISCEDGKGVYTHEMCFIKENENIFIDYTSDEQSFDHGPKYGTVLEIEMWLITDFQLTKEKVIRSTVSLINNRLLIQRNYIYTITLIKENKNNTEKEILATTRIIPVDVFNSKSDFFNISYNFDFFSTKGKIGDNSITYELTIYGENLCTSKEKNNNNLWYVKKGQNLRIFYSEGYWYYESGGSNSATGIGGHGKAWSYTTLSIKDFENNILPYTIKNNTWNSIKAEKNMNICLYNTSGSEGSGVPTSETTNLMKSIKIIVDSEPPEIKPAAEKAKYITKTIEEKETWITKILDITAEDQVTGVKQFKVQDIVTNNVYGENDDGSRLYIESLEEGEYEVIATDYVGNINTREVIIDRTGPEIKIYTDKDFNDEFSPQADCLWTNKDLYIEYEDLAGVAKSSEGVYTQTGVYELWAVDTLENENKEKPKIYIDKKTPSFTVNPVYESKKDENSNNYKSCFTLNITDIADAHSGIAGISVNTFVDGISKEIKTITISEIGKNSIENKIYTFELTDRNKDNYVRFEVNVTDAAGNTKTIPLGGDKGYFVPAAISTSYKELGNEETEKNKVQVNFYKKDTSTALDIGKYLSIKLQRHFSLTDKNNKKSSNEITETSFGRAEGSLFNESVKHIWENLTAPTADLKEDISENCYVDTAIEGKGFTHKNIFYDCIYEYANPVGDKDNPVITETICNTEKLALSNNKGHYSIRIKGEEGSYLLINDKGEVSVDTPESSFKMPETGVVGLAIKVDDPDLEPYQIQLQGYVELTSKNGKFKLQETDTDPVGTQGATAGCGKAELCDDNKNMFISSDKPMDGNWVELGDYALQYNITTVLSVELTEGFPGSEEEWTDKSVRLYAQSPSVLGGKARLLVGEAGSYNADGITARPWQPFKMEIVPADENQTVTELFWDFGNGLTSDACGDYDKKSNSKFENIYYRQSEKRTGALSEYKLKIRSGSDEAEFKVNIIDTQWGELLGDEVWRGEHIIKKEIIVPADKTLQIGDIAHSDYDSDITCLCVGKINPEDKGGITVEQGGTLKIDEGSTKHIKFIQGVLGTDSYEPATVKSFENRWKGIKVKGKLEGDRLDVADAEKALVIQGEGSAAFTRAIELNDCLEGILMNGAELKAEEIDISGSESSVSGIKTNKKIDCKTIKITGAGRGIILLSGGEFDIKTLEISGCKTGIHLLGGNLKIESGVISGCSEYGIKKEKGGSIDYGAFSFEGNERNIYENGIIR